MDISFGFHIRDYDVLFESSFGLEITQEFPGSVTAPISFGFYCYPSANFGHALLPALHSFGGVIPDGYGHGIATLPALYADGEGGFYEPPDTEYGAAFLPPPYSYGVLVTSCPGDGDADLPAMLSKGGEGNYGESSVDLPGLISLGYYGGREDTAYCVELMYAIDGVSSSMDHVVVIDETGQITDTITAAREQVQAFIESLESEGTITVLGNFIISVDESIQTSADLIAAVQQSDGSYPASLPNTSRVWVVNMDTGASSQYDDYGFDSFFEDDGNYYGVAEDGIYLLEGDDDVGSEIGAEIDFGRHDFGSRQKKKVPAVYIGASCDGELYMKVEADGSTYTYQARSDGEMTNHRVTPGKGLAGVYWKFTLVAEDDFAMETIDFVPIPSSRKI